MPRGPRTWVERFLASLEAHPSPAQQSWRWAREGEDPVDPRAVETAWDLVTLHASAEANKLNQALRSLPSEAHRTLLLALVSVGARRTEVGTFEVVPPEGKSWRPRDLAFVPGRLPLEADLRLECLQEVGRSVCDFRLWYRHRGYARIPTEGEVPDEHLEVTAERMLAILITDESLSGRQQADERHKDLELESEGYLVHRVAMGDIWRDAMAVAENALASLQESAKFDCAALVSEREAAG